MAKVTRKEWYRRVNATWPETVPPLTAEEAVRAAKRLCRYVTGETWKREVVVTSGNRYSGRHWVRKNGAIVGMALVVNPERGWRHLIHELSHTWERYAGTHGHNAAHARLEMRMIKEVIRRGWLDGKLKDKPRPEPSPVDPRAAKIERTAAAIERWEKKLRRAENALKKLRRRQRAMERYAAKSAA